jgi:hypothetical protein
MRKTAKQKRREALLVWVYDQHDPGYLNAKRFAEAMTCEALSSEEAPYHHRKAITEFRHLRTDARVAACQAFLERQR